MPFEVLDPQIDLHKENIFYRGDLLEILEDDGKFGPQLKWVIELDDDDPWIDDDGKEQPRQTWTWSSQKLTTSDKSKFRQYVKGLTGKEPTKGELFDERHYTKTFYRNNPSENPEQLTGQAEPWRVAVMFTHGKKPDGTPKENVSLLVGEAQII